MTIDIGQTIQITDENFKTFGRYGKYLGLTSRGRHKIFLLEEPMTGKSQTITVASDKSFRLLFPFEETIYNLDTQIYNCRKLEEEYRNQAQDYELTKMMIILQNSQTI